MADNSVLNSNTTVGDTYRSVQKGTPKTQVVALDLGGSGTENLGALAGTAGTPATPVLSVQGVSGGTAQPVSAASLPLPSGAATSAAQTTGNASLSSIDGKITACNTAAVVVASSALPSGAATAAKQPALGTAGTASTDVITVQGRAGMTPVLVDGSGATQPISGSVTANAGTNLNTSALALEATLSSLNAKVTAVNTGAVTISAALPAGSNIIGNVRIDQTTPGTTNGVQVNAALPAGTNAIGKLAANSGVDIGDVDVTTQPARVATTDSITAKLATDAIQNGLTALTPKFVIIDAASSGDNTILAAVSAKKIRVLALFMVAAGAVVARFESGAGGTALTGQMNLAANGGFVLPFNPVGWFETASNTLLNLELGGAVSCDGSLTYVEV